MPFEAIKEFLIVIIQSENSASTHEYSEKVSQANDDDDDDDLLSVACKQLNFSKQKKNNWTFQTPFSIFVTE